MGQEYSSEWGLKRKKKPLRKLQIKQCSSETKDLKGDNYTSRLGSEPPPELHDLDMATVKTYELGPITVKIGWICSITSSFITYHSVQSSHDKQKDDIA